MEIKEAIEKRKSIRKYYGEVSDDEMDALIWAAKQTPSAGAIRPLRFMVVRDQATRDKLWRAARKQDPVRFAPAVIVISAKAKRMLRKYGDSRGWRYIYMEAGHAAQNIYLTAVSIGIGTVAIGAFSDSGVKSITGHDLLYIMPVGRV